MPTLRPPHLAAQGAAAPRGGRLRAVSPREDGAVCAHCRLLIAHRDELEGELTTIFTRLAPAVVGGAYAVLGTVELRAWRRGMAAATTIEDVLRHTVPFTATLTVEYRPATWVPTHPTAKPEPE